MVVEENRVDFSGLGKFNGEDVEKVLSSQAGKYLEDGQHDVEITEVDFSKRNQKDPSWINAKISFLGVGNKIGNGFLCVPTSKLTFGDRESSGMLSSFSEFINALQINKPWDFICKNMNLILNQLNGKYIKINLGYPKGVYFIKYLDKNKFVIVDPDGNNLRENGKDILFSSKDAAKAEFNGNYENKKLVEYMSVLSYSPSKEQNYFKFSEEKKKGWG